MMKLHTESFLASQDDYTKMSDAYKCRNEVVSVLDLLLQAFSNSIYLEQDSQLRSINYLWLKSSTRNRAHLVSLSPYLSH